MGVHSPRIRFKFSCRGNPAETGKVGTKTTARPELIPGRGLLGSFVCKLGSRFPFSSFFQISTLGIPSAKSVPTHPTHTYTHANDKGEIIECSPSYRCYVRTSYILQML